MKSLFLLFTGLIFAGMQPAFAADCSHYLRPLRIKTDQKSIIALHDLVDARYKAVDVMILFEEDSSLQEISTAIKKYGVVDAESSDDWRIAPSIISSSSWTFSIIRLVASDLGNFEKLVFEKVVKGFFVTRKQRD